MALPAQHPRDRGTDAAWRARVLGRSLGPAADRAVERAGALIAAMGRLIRTSDNHDPTMQQVANEAGLSLRVLYQHFAGKDDLLLALMEETLARFAEMIERRAAAHDDPLEALGAALYFASDERQHTSPEYNRALARYSVTLSVNAPEQLGLVRRPVVEAFTGLVQRAMAVGRLEGDDPQVAASCLVLAHQSFVQNRNLGNSMGTAPPSGEGFIRFCLLGIGAQLPPHWEERFRVDAAEARRRRREALGPLKTRLSFDDNRVLTYRERRRHGRGEGG